MVARLLCGSEKIYNLILTTPIDKKRRKEYTNGARKGGVIMLGEVIKKKFDFDTPIFTDEIISLFPQYTRAYVFRMIKDAESRGEIAKIDTGVYYIPQMTPFGPTVITASAVARKKYITDESSVYGIYSGLALQNAFSLTTQVTNTQEIVTNRETTRCRKITIDGMPFVLRKSRTEITEKNADAYRVLQVFSENNGVTMNEAGTQAISDFIRKKDIKREQLLDLARSFPAKTLQNLIYSEVLYAAT